MKVIIEGNNGQKREITGTATWGGVVEGVLTFVKEICDYDPDETAEILSLIEEYWEGSTRKKRKNQKSWKKELETYAQDVIKKYPDCGEEWAFGAINFLHCIGKVTGEEAEQIYEQFDIR